MQLFHVARLAPSTPGAALGGPNGPVYWHLVGRQSGPKGRSLRQDEQYPRGESVFVRLEIFAVSGKNVHIRCGVRLLFLWLEGDVVDILHSISMHFRLTGVASRNRGLKAKLSSMLWR